MDDLKKVREIKYLVIGAGPGGLQMGYYLEKAGRDYLILDRSDTAGSFFSKFPIHRKLISINKKENFFPEDEFNWRHDWNSLLSDDPEMRFTNYSDELYPSADTLHEYLRDFANHFDLNISFGVDVVQIEKNSDGKFLITTGHGDQIRCSVLLMGLGSLAPMVPEDIEGIDLATGYDDQIVDKEFYRNKRVGILGQGNAAFETAEALVGIASFVHVLTKHPVKMAWDTHFVGDVRAVNNGIFDMYQLKSMHAVLNPRVKSIRKTEDGLLETSHEYDFPEASRPGTLQLTREYDVLLRCTGWKWVDEHMFAGNALPQTWYRGKLPELTPLWESKNVKNMYFVGGAMQGNDRQAASGFIHGYRYNIRTLHNLLEEQHEGVAYPTTQMDPLNWNDLLNWMYDRMSVTAALFQLWGVLCDTLVFSNDLQTATLYKELPLGVAKNRDYGDQHVLIMTLDFGFDKFDKRDSALQFMGPSDPLDTTCAAFLHPVIRHIHEGTTDEFHFGGFSSGAMGPSSRCRRCGDVLSLHISKVARGQARNRLTVARTGRWRFLCRMDGSGNRSLAVEKR